MSCEDALKLFYERKLSRGDNYSCLLDGNKPEFVAYAIKQVALLLIDVVLTCEKDRIRDLDAVMLRLQILLRMMI